MLEEIEHVTHVIARCAITEGLYFGTTSGLANSLDSRLTALLRSHLVSLYAAVLRFLTKAGHYYNKGTSSKFTKSSHESIDDNLLTYTTRPNAQEHLHSLRDCSQGLSRCDFGRRSTGYAKPPTR